MSSFANITSDSLGASGKSVYIDSADSGYVFELIGLDSTLTLDVSASYEAALVQQGLADASGLVTIAANASDFDDMFKITIDSSDLDDLSSNDVMYDVSDTTFPSVTFSSGIVSSGNVNTSYTGTGQQAIKYDVVRHIAKCITGGYAAADIFSNEDDLVTDVENHDASFSEAFTDILEAVDASNTILSTDVLSTAKNLLAVTLNDATAGSTRRSDLLSAIATAGASATGSITVPLKFYAGDKIVVRIEYAPASNHPAGGTVTNRSYKVVLDLA